MITIGGHPLLIPDAELAAWVQDHLPLADDLFGTGAMDRVSNVGPKPNSFTENSIGTGQINWPPPPPLKLSSLWWPTGASRFARGVFLADEETAKKIIDGTESGLTSLEISDGSKNYFAQNFDAIVMLLPPRMISAPTGETLWLIPVTDSRYRWQWQGVELPSVSGSWKDLALAILGSIEEDYIGNDLDNIESEYLVPDWQEFARPGSSAMAMLDAMAASIGRRVVFNCKAIYFNFPASSHSDFYDYHVSDREKGIIAGGKSWDTDHGQPSTVGVSFPHYRHGRLDSQGRRWGNNSESGQVSIRSTCVANFSHHRPGSDSDDGNPHNLTKLALLDGRIALDYFAWRDRAYDFCFAGCFDNLQSGRNDYFEISAGSLDSAGNPQFQTRVKSLPHDVYCDVQLSQDPDLIFLGKYQLGQIVEPEDLEPLLEEFLADGIAQIWRDGLATAIKLPVHYLSSGNQPAIDDYVELHWMAEENCWYATKVEYSLTRFELTENLALGGEAAAEIVKWTGAAYEKTGDAITVKDFTGRSWRGRTGYQGLTHYTPDSGKCEIVWMEHIAKSIDFTLTEYMGETNAGEAACTIDHYWDGLDPSTGHEEFAAKVRDSKGLFSLALDGAVGKARIRFNGDGGEEYEIVECETAANDIIAAVGGSISDGEATAGTVERYWGPDSAVMNPAAGSPTLVFPAGLVDAVTGIEAATSVHASLDRAASTPAALKYVAEAITYTDESENECAAVLTNKKASDIPGYDAEKWQVLGHAPEGDDAADCFRWVDVDQCEPPEEEEPPPEEE